MQTTCPASVVNDLSDDQKYLYNIVHAIQSGSLNDTLQSRKPGPIFMARWLTLASRILRLYVTFEKPSRKLRILAEYIVKVYAPMWFSVKLRPNVLNGSRHLFSFIKSIEKLNLSKKLKGVLQSVIQHDAYFGHTDQVFLAMLNDDNRDIREKAVKLIMKSRSSNQNNYNIREVKVPILLFATKPRNGSV